METYVYILIGAYIVTCAVALAITPVVQTLMPQSFQPGHKLAWMGVIACIISIICSPVLLLGLGVYLPAYWALDNFQRCVYGRCTSCTSCTSRHLKKKDCKEEQKQKKRAQKAHEDMLEQGCNYEDSILSLSEMPPMYEDCLFKATSTASSASPRQSLY